MADLRFAELPIKYLEIQDGASLLEDTKNLYQRLEFKSSGVSIIPRAIKVNLAITCVLHYCTAFIKLILLSRMRLLKRQSKCCCHICLLISSTERVSNASKNFGKLSKF